MYLYRYMYTIICSIYLFIYCLSVFLMTISSAAAQAQVSRVPVYDLHPLL